MRLRLGLAAFAVVFLLSASAFGYDADWWYAKYQKLGGHDPKWDALVREGIDHWMKGCDAKSGADATAELALSVKALEKAYAAGCRCPIALFVDARNQAQITADGTPELWDRFQVSLGRTEKRPDLTFVRIPCANAFAWRMLRGGEYKEAIPYFEMALSLSSPDVEDEVFQQAKAGLQQAREKLAAQQDQRGQLAALALPSHPTKEQARACVRRVIYLAGKKTGYGSNDPEIALLEKVGPENLDVLLESWGTAGAGSAMAHTVINAYLKAAVERLARAGDKALLLKWLPLQESLAEIMQRKGWAQDMRPFLVARIAERSMYTDPGVLRAAAALRDPAAYDDLIWHFENDQNGLSIYDDLKKLPGIQLKDAVARMWAASKSWTDWRASNRYILAVAAMDYGVKDALEFAVAKFDSPDVGEWFRDNLREAICQRTGLRGSDDEIRAWFQASKGKLVFDENKRMFQPNP